MVDAWAEVRQLVEDFRELQSSDTGFKLSERNCIELLTTLHDVGLVDLWYTLDGKEFVTPSCVEKEIKNELQLCKGRSTIVDIQKVLNIDFKHIEAKVSEILKHDRSITLLSGELITRGYLDVLCEEINDNLQEMGQLDVAELSKIFSLPNDFLLETIESAMNFSIKGELDKSGSGIIYTESYIRRYRSRILGLFSAITCPAPVGPIILNGHFQEHLFFTVLQDLISCEEIKGTLQGQREKSVFVPDVFVSLQAKWTQSFYLANGYIEFEALSRIGVENPGRYIQQHMVKDGENIEILYTCAVSNWLLNELESAVEELKITEKGWVDVQLYLPSICSVNDAELLAERKYSSSPDVQVIGKFLTSCKLAQESLEIFSGDIKDRAFQIASMHPLKVSDIAQHFYIMETKFKSGHKAKKSKSSTSHSVDNFLMDVGIEFMTQQEVVNKLSTHLLHNDELSQLVYSNIKKALQTKFIKEVVNTHSERMKLKEKESSIIRKNNFEMQQRIENLWNMIRLFSMGINHFEDNKVMLSKYLLKTLGSDLVSIILVCLSSDNGIVCNEQELCSNKDRALAISKLPEKVHVDLSALNLSLNDKDLYNFFEVFQKVCKNEYCGIRLKKMEKKRERQLIYTHQISLKEKLKEENDHAVCFHLIVVILFCKTTNAVIHIPGKFVPNVITFLSSCVSDEIKVKLRSCQKLITAQWKLSASLSDKDTDLPDHQKSQSTISEPSESSMVQSECSGEIHNNDDHDLIALIKELKQFVL